MARRVSPVSLDSDTTESSYDSSEDSDEEYTSHDLRKSLQNLTNKKKIELLMKRLDLAESKVSKADLKVKEFEAMKEELELRRKDGALRKELIKKFTVNDVLLLFPCRDSTSSEPPQYRSLWSSTALLKSASSYYNDMFSAGFSESNLTSVAFPKPFFSPQDVDEAEDDSDMEAERATPPRGAEIASMDAQVHSIVLRNTSYKTYKALLTYLITRKVVFAPLRAVREEVNPPPSEASKRRKQNGRQSEAADQLDESPAAQPGSLSKKRKLAPLPRSASASAVSPKSLYRLVDLISYMPLEVLCLQEMARALTTCSASVLVKELFSNFAESYHQYRKIITAAIIERWDEVSDSEGKGISLLEEELNKGDREVKTKIVLELMKKLRT